MGRKTDVTAFPVEFARVVVMYFPAEGEETQALKKSAANKKRQAVSPASSYYL